MLSSSRSAFLGCRHRRPLNSIEPPWYGPVCPVVWEGRSRKAPPYPDQFRMVSPERCPRNPVLPPSPASAESTDDE
jgi:hypothetical protein